MTTQAQHEHDVESAKIAAALGMEGSLRLLMEARRAGLSQSLGLALRTQETGIRGDGNVFGHDPTIFVGVGVVTKSKYLRYKAQRGRNPGRCQGVGPLQLTYWSIQDRADELGGCWLVKFNYRVGFEDLATLIADHGERKGLAIYNGGSRRPNYQYADSVERFQRFWHGRLT